MIFVALLLLASVSLLYVPFRWRPVGIYLFLEKTLALAYVPLIAASGVALAIMGAVTGSQWTVVLASMAALGALVVMVRIGAVRADLSGALGAGCLERISAERRAAMIGRWWTGPLPRRRRPRLRRDVPFATVPGSDRVLLCDVWEPRAGVESSGVAVVFLHGGAYCVLDKDCGTRPLFRQLAARGHVVVDVAYRLFPETDVAGMVGDAKRAIAWVRVHAADLAIDPECIVLAGGSMSWGRGGHPRPASPSTSSSDSSP